MTTPHVSILIPNFNNGPSSANDGRRDFLGDLLQSLHDTLADDPTPVEIIIADDGSTDESLDTARQWAQKTWSQGGRDAHPFCTLIELDHCGVLSVVANRLTNEATGDILVRLDGDIVVHTNNWASELKRIYESAPPDLGVVGPLQLSPDGYVHAAGDWLLHPRGYHHIAQGITPSAVTRAVEVDHVMGCFYCFTRTVWEAVGEYDETIMRGQTVDYGVRARLAGFRTWSVPTIEFSHYHNLRRRRANAADGEHAITMSQQRFEQKWGFSRLAPDLDEVAQRYAGTPLLWNARVFGPAAIGQRSSAPTTLETSRWKLYAQNQQLQNIINAQVALTMQHIGNATDTSGPVVQFGCGDGIMAHLLAQNGLDVIGIDGDESLLTLARRMTGSSQYDSAPPRFVHQLNPRELPIENGTASWALMLNVIETHPNPVGLLKQAHAALRPGGSLLIVTPMRPTPLDSDVDRSHLFRPHELDGLLHNTGLFEATAPTQGPTPIGLVRILRRVGAGADSHCTSQQSASLEQVPVGSA